MGGTYKAIMRGEAEPMDVHKSRKIYFKVLHKDPYGLKNKTYQWSGENQFVAWVAPIMFLGVLGV